MADGRPFVTAHSAPPVDIEYDIRGFDEMAATHGAVGAVTQREIDLSLSTPRISSMTCSPRYWSLWIGRS